MHLKDARIDLEGDIVAKGTVGFPRHPEDAFSFAPHDCVVLLLRGGSVSFVPCTAERDAETGFFETSRVGPITQLPDAVNAALLASLQSISPKGLRIELPQQDGYLYTFEGGYKQQPLSDWTMQVNSLDGIVQFHLSAALRMLEPTPFSNETNYWQAADGVWPRIDIRFEVDSVTRTARFEVPLRAAAEDRQIPSGAFPQVGRWLEGAPIDQSGAFYGVSPSGLVRLEQVSDGKLVVSPGGSSRLANGFLGERRWGVDYPRIWLNGINLESLTDILRDETLSIDFGRGDLGLVQNEMRNEIPSQTIREAKIAATRGEAGLTVSYHLGLSVPEPGLPSTIDDSFTLPWGLLILRFPTSGVVAAHVHARRRSQRATKP